MAQVLSLSVIYLFVGVLVAFWLMATHYRVTREVISPRIFWLAVLTWPAIVFVLLFVPPRTH